MGSCFQFGSTEPSRISSALAVSVRPVHPTVECNNTSKTGRLASLPPSLAPGSTAMSAAVPTK